MNALGFVGTLLSVSDIAGARWTLGAFFGGFVVCIGWLVWTQQKRIARLEARRRAIDMGFSLSWEGCLQETRLIDPINKRWVTERRFRIGVMNFDEAPVTVRLEVVDIQPRTGNVFAGAPLGAETHVVMPSGEGPPTKTIDLCYEIVADNDISTSLYVVYADSILRGQSLIRDRYQFTLRLSGVGEPKTRRFQIGFDEETERLNLRQVLLPLEQALWSQPVRRP